MMAILINYLCARSSRKKELRLALENTRTECRRSLRAEEERGSSSCLGKHSGSCKRSRLDPTLLISARLAWNWSKRTCGTSETSSTVSNGNLLLVGPLPHQSISRRRNRAVQGEERDYSSSTLGFRPGGRRSQRSRSTTVSFKANVRIVQGQLTMSGIGTLGATFTVNDYRSLAIVRSVRESTFENLDDFKKQPLRAVLERERERERERNVIKYLRFPITRRCSRLRRSEGRWEARSPPDGGYRLD